LCIPTEEARELATRTQQILANEIGAARTADPLGGSWYVESLTRQVEAEALAILARIEKIGLIEAIENGTIEAMLDEYNYTHQRELDLEERIVVGVNKFKPRHETLPQRFSFDPARTAEHQRRFRERKVARDAGVLASRIADVYRAAHRRENSHQAMIDALAADATIGEVWGTVRVASGLPYDPFQVLTNPFSLPSL